MSFRLSSHVLFLVVPAGGGGNFGVVTEFVFKAHPQRSTVFVTYLIYAIDKLESVLNAIGEWEKNAGPDEGLHWACMRVLPGMQVRQSGT